MRLKTCLGRLWHTSLVEKVKIYFNESTVEQLVAAEFPQNYCKRNNQQEDIIIWGITIMGRFTNLHFFQLAKLTKLSAVGALAIALAPGSLFATAIYDAGAFVDFEIVAEAGLDVFTEIDLNTISQATTGNALVSTAESNPLQGATSFTGQDVNVVGQANSDPVDQSSAGADARNIASLGFFNPTTNALNVVINFMYGAVTSATLDNPLLEIAGASASVLIEDVLNGVVIVDESIDDLGAGSVLPVFDLVSYTLALEPFAFGGIQSDILVEGFATANPTGLITVSAPPTLALMCIGLLALVSLKHRTITAT